MKRNILTGFVALASMALAFTSCNQDNIGPKFEGDLSKCIAFESMTVSGEVDAVENVVYLNATRLNGEGNVSVPITVDALPDGFSVDDAVTFADGETSTQVKVTAADVNALDENKSYKVVFRIPTENSLPTSSNNVTVNIGLRPEEFCIAEYDPWLFTSSWDVEVRKARTANRFTIYDAIVEGYNFVFAFNDDFTEFSAEPQDTGYEDPSYGMVFWEPTGEFEYSEQNTALAWKTKYGVSAGYFKDSSGQFLDFLYLTRPLYEKE